MKTLLRFKTKDGSSFCQRLLRQHTQKKGEVPLFRIGTLCGEPDTFISSELFARPCLSEQRKIAAFFDTVDAVVKSIEAELSVWQKLKFALIDKLLARELLVHDADGSAFPAWRQKTLRELGNLKISELKAIKLKLPSSSEEERKIASHLELFVQVVALTKCELAAWRTLKHGLWQEMLPQSISARRLPL